MSAESPSPSQLWAPPKSPLPPHRLAKLANALGVSMPMPATQPTSPYLSSPYLSHSNSLPTPSSAAEFLRRSPTPSAASTSIYQSPTSKYLLHVIPPLHLMHDFDVPDDVHPPPNASGYHTQFRRGTLVPVHPTLQLQLNAIAKEYALPSTIGLILYLVNHTPTPTLQAQDPTDELGPRLSDDVWRHLWVRVLKAEQRDEMSLSSPRAPSPNPLGLVLSAKSSPNPNGNALDNVPPFLRATPTPVRGTSLDQQPASPYPLTPSSSSVTTSDMQHKSKSSLSSSIAHSVPSSPDSSLIHTSLRADSLDLPGLTSNSIIPILAKVEFDIDRRKAAWYDPWVRSRKMNQVKRAESRASRRNDTMDDTSDEKERRGPPLDLKLTERLMTSSPISLKSLGVKDKEGGGSSSEEAAYQQLEDSTSEGSDYGNDNDDDEDDDDDDDDEAEDATARVVSVPNGRDPLSDVFGTDEETWAELRNSQLHLANKQRKSNPNVVELALTAADLANLPELPPSDDENDYDDDEGMRNLTKSEDEVEDLLTLMGRPPLSVSIPTSPPQGKKHVPPPLVLKPPGTDLIVPAESPQPSTGSARLAYLNNTSEENMNIPPGGSQLTRSVHPAEVVERGLDGGDDDDEDDVGVDVEDLARVKSPAESEKREGAIFDDLDLGLDLTEEFDENDPNDHRRSQLMMKAQLDEIERNLAQFSPKALRSDLSDSMSLPVSPNLSGVLRNSDVLPPTPGVSRLSDVFGQTPPPDSAGSGRQWPSVPFSSMRDTPDVPQTATFPASPTPPRLALNGVATQSRASSSSSHNHPDVSQETAARRRDLDLDGEGQELTYPAYHASMTTTGVNSDSPIIPLSPDPFGRYPSSSSPEIPSGSRMASTYWNGDGNPPASPYDAEFHNALNRGPSMEGRPPSSRFSADSTSNEEALTKSVKTNGNGNNSSGASIMSVKSIRKLWRKSNKSSISSVAASASGQGTISGRTSPATSLMSGRPSEDLSVSSPPALPTTPTFGAFPPPPPPPTQMQMQQMQQQQQQQQFMGRDPNAPPPLTLRTSLAPPASMGPPMGPPPPLQDRRDTLTQLQFDQESPYPIHRSPVIRYSPQPPSPAWNQQSLPPMQPPPSQSQSQPPQTQGQQAQPLAPPAEKPSVRKSILKAFRGTSSNNANNTSQPADPRGSMDRSGRSRRGSVSTSGQASPMLSSDIPPSPRIPEHLLTGAGPGVGRPPSRPRSNTAMARPASPPKSMASSRDSEETRPSFDTSQFEMVSPKMSSTLSYPYHGLDHS